MTLEKRIQACKHLTPAETEIGHYILTHAQDVIHMSLQDLCNALYFSKSAIHRFCKKIGCTGFNDVKVQLSQDLSNNRLTQHDIDVNYPFTKFDAPMNIAEKLADLLAELKTEKDSFKKLGIDYEEKAFYDILKAVAKKYEFDNEYPDEKMIELSKKIKVIVDDKSRYTDWSTRDDIKANLQVDLILLLDEYGYPPVTLDDVYKEVLEQAENFKKYAG